MSIPRRLIRKLSTFKPSLFLAVFLVIGSFQFSPGAETTPQIGIRSKTPDARAFVNARIIVSPGIEYEKGSLLIGDGYVIDVGENIDIPEGVTVVDLDGMTLLPGFIDPFTDYGIGKTEKPKRMRNRRPQYLGKRVGGNAWNDAIHAEKQWALSFKPDKDESEELIKLGFTAVQSASQDGIFRGRACVALLGVGLPNDLLIKPYANHFASFDKGNSQQSYPSSLMGKIALIRQTFFDVEWYRKAHRAYELNRSQDFPEFNAAIEALADIKNEKIIFDCGENSLSLFRAGKIGTEFDIPMVLLAGGKEYAYIEDVKSLGSQLIVPLDFPVTPEINTYGDELDVTLGQLRHWETAPSNPAQLEKNDIEFALTTYRLKKKSDFRKRLKTAIKNGLSPEKALEALTTVPAKICGIEEIAGTLEKGKLANFIICDGDIFSDSSEIYSVWIAGKKNEIKPIPTTVYAGHYKLVVDEKDFTLVLEGKPSELSGEIKSGDWSKKLSNVKSEGNHLTFAAVLDSAQSSGINRFSGRKEAGTIVGKCLLESGESVSWTAMKFDPAADTTEKAEDEESGDDKESEPEKMVAGFTHPNVAFGSVSLPEAENVIIKNGTVWTADKDGIIENCDIIVSHGKFEKVGPDLTAPPGYRIIDASGKHVTPGIIDAHSHIAISGDVNEGTFAVTPEVEIGDVLNPDNIHIYRQLAGGVTTSLLMHGSANPIGGQCQTIKLRWGSNAEGLKFAGATPIIKFALGENVKQSNWGDNNTTRYPQTRMGVRTIIEDEFQAALEYQADWKKYNSLGKNDKKKAIAPRKDIRLDAIVEVLNSRMMVHCHSYAQSETLMLMRLAEKFGFTIGVFVHMLEGYKVADEIALHGAGATTFSDWWAYKFEVYDAIPHNAALMAERNVLTSINSDNADLARRLNQEAAKSIKYGGMSREEAIKLVTINSAIHLGVGDYTGSIKEGKDADFVIWNSDPLSVYARVEQTWLDGKKYYSQTDDKKLQAEIAVERNRLIQKILSASEGGDNGDKTRKAGRKKTGHRYPPNDYSQKQEGE